jgi:hypothetical protein
VTELENLMAKISLKNPKIIHTNGPKLGQKLNDPFLKYAKFDNSVAQI